MKTRSLALAGSLVLASAFTASAIDIPDAGEGRSAPFRGVYKVVSCSDPIFPTLPDTEYFMDFGRGIEGSKMSGSVSVSMRRNPNVKVRIMAWQYFPEKSTMVLGNPYSEGSRNAVARAVWKMSGTTKGVIFERGRYQVVLHRADPADY